MKKIELLAPCGTFEALIAAIAAKCDAVYLGGSSFSARAFAQNFNDEEMVKAIKLAHIYNVKVYVTLNTLIYDHEFKEVISYVRFLYNNDVDAIIVQDLGLMNVVLENFPDLEVHASTQMTLHNIEGVKLLREKGVKRVVLARENSIDDINKINQNVNIETEVFVHGALCVCYSGQCLMSSLIGGRSGNRGKCAQPCRKPYQLYLNNELIEKNKYFISPKDLNTVEHIDKLIEAGVHSLKIEGRLKSPEYVAIVVSTYRKAINQYYENKKIKLTNDELNDLSQIFNRQFTKGFLFHSKGNDYINLEKNNNTGLLCGVVLSSDNNKIRIKLSRSLAVQDGIYFNNTDVGMTVSKIIINNKEVKEAKGGDIVVLDVVKNIPKNVEVFKTTDVRLLEKTQKLYQSLNQLIPIQIELDMYIGSKPRLTIADELNNKVTKEIDFTIEKSIKQNLDENRIREQLSKLGNTPFYADSIKINKDEDAFIIIGALNNLRREAIDELAQIREKKHHRIKSNFVYEFNEETGKVTSEEIISAYCHTNEQVAAAQSCGLSQIYVNEAIYDSLDNKDKLIIAKDRIQYSPILKSEDEVLVSDLGSLFLAKNNKKVISNVNLNVTNSESIHFLKENNVDIVTLSYEMNDSIFKNLSYLDRSNLEVIVYGYQDSMITKHCVFAQNCKRQCQSEHYQLEDEKKEKFTLLFEQNCHMRILNSKKMILSDEVVKLKKYGYNRFRIQLTTENYSETRRIIEAYKKLIHHEDLTEIVDEVEQAKQLNLYTRGYFNKDIL